MKHKIIIKKKFITFIFVYFIFLTSYFSITTLSKYVGVSSGTGTSTIAKWVVSIDTSDNTSNTLDVVIGNDNYNPSYILKITSTSEVKASYSIILSNVPNQLEVKLDTENTYRKTTTGTINFDNVGYINANANINDRTITHTLTFRVPIDSSDFNGNNVDIDVIFNQVNPTSN